MIRCRPFWRILSSVLFVLATFSSQVSADERKPQRSPAPQVPSGFEKLTIPFSTAVTGTAVGQGVTIAVTAEGEVASLDGSDWNHRFAASRPLSDISFGSGRFIAVGEGGTAISSADGLTWQQVTTGVSSDLRGITWANNTWVAVGDDGTVITSASGDAWTNRTTPTTAPLIQPVFTGTRWMAAGDDGSYCSSTDSVTWSCSVLPLLDGGQKAKLTGIAAGGSTVLAAGPEMNPDGSPSGRTAIFSFDSTGKPVGSSLLDNSFTGLCSGNGAFLLVGGEGRVRVSSDGATWTLRDIGDASALSRCVFSTNRFYVSGSSGALYRSKDVTAAQLEFSQSSLEFGNVSAGVGTRIRSLFAMNTGFVPIAMDSAALTGGADFLLDDDCSGTVLAPGDFCELEVRFTPAATGEQVATMTVVSDDPQAPETVIEVSGTGVINEVVSIQILGPRTVAPGHAESYRIQAIWKDGSITKVTADDWSVDDLAVASISSDGFFTAGAVNRPAAVTIIASCTIDGEVFDIEKVVVIREEPILAVMIAPNSNPSSWRASKGVIICRVIGSGVTATAARNRVSTENPWIRITGVSVSHGKARITFATARSDTIGERDGRIDVDGQWVLLIQEGAPVRVEASTTRSKFAASGGSAEVTASADPADGKWRLVDVQWKPAAEAGWLQGVTEGESGEGSVTKVITAAQNLSGRARSVTLIFSAMGSGKKTTLKLTQLR